MEIIDKIRRNSKNQLFWKRVKFDPKKVAINLANNFYTEGHQYFFNKLGKLIPSESKYFISYISVMVNREDGEILIFDHGRFTFIIKDGKKNSKKELETLDGFISIKDIGKEWSILFLDDEDELNAEVVYNIFN